MDGNSFPDEQEELWIVLARGLMDGKSDSVLARG